MECVIFIGLPAARMSTSTGRGSPAHDRVGEVLPRNKRRPLRRQEQLLLEPPSREEGFDELFDVLLEGERRFEVIPRVGDRF